MGLDAVELLLDIEWEFHVSISDSDAADVTTVGELDALVASLAPDAERRWERVRACVARWTRVKEADIERAHEIVADLGIR